MSSLRYLGKAPTDPNHLITKLTTDNTYTAVGGVTTSDLSNRVSTQTSPLADKATVDANDNNLVAKTYVDSQDGLHVLKTAKAAASGVCELDANGLIPNARMLRYPRIPFLGPYPISLLSNVPEAYYDSSGQWDQSMGSVTIPAPGSSFGSSWRPLILGRFEVYNYGGSGRTDVFVRNGSIEMARARGRNAGSDQPYGITVMPESDVTGQTPGGWGTTSGMTLNFFLSAVFNGTRGGLAGANGAAVYVVRT